MKLEDQIKRKITELRTTAAADMAEAAKLSGKATNEKQFAAELQDMLDAAKPAPMSMSMSLEGSKTPHWTLEQAAKDLDFLLPRAMQASKINFQEVRDTGASSNSIVAIAYGLNPLHNQELPADQSDLEACKLMWSKLPQHRKTEAAAEALRKAINAIELVCVGCGLKKGQTHPDEPTVSIRPDGYVRCADCESKRVNPRQ
jgi:hypothetical protein